jgi:hypothetical protein
MADREGDRVTGEHIDEGTAHAWLDDQLPPDDAARIESHIATCAECAAVVAEARGFMAASSRILTALDGVPSQVVPRSRARARIWQVRAAAAVIVVAVGVAAVLRHTWTPDNSYGAYPKAPVARPAEAPAPPAAVTPTPATPAPVTAAPAQAAQNVIQPPEKKQAPAASRLREAERAGSTRELQPSLAPPAARAANDSDQPVLTGAMASAAPSPRPVQDSATNGPQATPRIALAAKAMRAPAAQSAAMRQGYFDSITTRDAAGMVAAGAHGRCAGKVVSVSVDDSSAGVLVHRQAVRLDSVPRPSSARAFVVRDPVGDAAVDGWWLPAGADSAVVSMVRHPSATVAGVAGGSPGAAPPDTARLAVTRVRCPAF